jgi:hypothetical protein
VSASGTPSSGADVMLGTTYADMLDPLVLSFVQLGIIPDGLFRSYRPTLEVLIAAIPSRRVEMQLRSRGPAPERSADRCGLAQAQGAPLSCLARGRGSKGAFANCRPEVRPAHRGLSAGLIL